MTTLSIRAASGRASAKMRASPATSGMATTSAVPPACMPDTKRKAALKFATLISS
jgi:hypothetical protein